MDQAAMNSSIDLCDGIFDWSKKAVLIKNYPSFYKEIIADQYNKTAFNHKRSKIFQYNGEFVQDLCLQTKQI